MTSQKDETQEQTKDFLQGLCDRLKIDGVVYHFFFGVGSTYHAFRIKLEGSQVFAGSGVVSISEQLSEITPVVLDPDTKFSPTPLDNHHYIKIARLTDHMRSCSAIYMKRVFSNPLNYVEFHKDPVIAFVSNSCSDQNIESLDDYNMVESSLYERKTTIEDSQALRLRIMHTLHHHSSDTLQNTSNHKIISRSMSGRDSGRLSRTSMYIRSNTNSLRPQAHPASPPPTEPDTDGVPPSPPTSSACIMLFCFGSPKKPRSPGPK